jgi:KDO2-lipid IV(A) lauroyltransferase
MAARSRKIDMGNMRLARTGQFAAYLLIRLFVCLLQALRIETCARLARGLAWLAMNVIPLRRGLVDENLRHAFPEMSAEERRRTARRMWEHLFLMAIEVIQAPRKIHETNWRQYTTLVRSDYLIRSFFDDRPTVIICGHYGNFELSGYLLGLLGFRSFTIARKLSELVAGILMNDSTGMFHPVKKRVNRPPLEVDAASGSEFNHRLRFQTGLT